MEFHSDGTARGYRSPDGLLPVPADDGWRVQHSRKKDTKHWCRGKVGREHKPVIELDKAGWMRTRECRPVPEGSTWPFWQTDKHGYVCYHQVNCETCGKRLADTPERCPENTAL